MVFIEHNPKSPRNNKESVCVCVSVKSVSVRMCAIAKSEEGGGQRETRWAGEMSE